MRRAMAQDQLREPQRSWRSRCGQVAHGNAHLPHSGSETAGLSRCRHQVTSNGPTSTLSVTTAQSTGATNGLTGQYFNNMDFTAPVLTRTDSNINFNWGTASPAAGVKVDNFSVRWTGRVEAPVTGNYQFSTASDDGIRVWVNGQLVINNWTDHAPTTNTSAAIALTAGTRYTIKVEYYEHTGGATARLQWSYPGQATQVVPQSRLFQ